MNTSLNLIMASVLAVSAAIPAYAQDNLTGVEDLNDRIENISDAADENLDESNDSQRFSPTGVDQGWGGSAALTASATSGNTDTTDLSIAARLNYGVGDWNHSFGLATEFGESDGVKTKETNFATYEGSRYFNPRFYAFGTARLEADEFSTNKADAFVGAGVGYRILNTDVNTWRVQAGPGLRYTKGQDDVSTTEEAMIASSRYYYKLTDTVSFTNDTDVLGSSANTVVSNDLGVNFKVSDKLTTRVSYRTDYNSDPLAGEKSTDNTLGLAVVMGF